MDALGLYQIAHGSTLGDAHSCPAGFANCVSFKILGLTEWATLF